MLWCLKRGSTKKKNEKIQIGPSRLRVQNLAEFKRQFLDAERLLKEPPAAAAHDLNGLAVDTVAAGKQDALMEFVFSPFLPMKIF